MSAKFINVNVYLMLLFTNVISINSFYMLYSGNIVGGGSGCNYFLPTFLFFIYSKLDKNVNLAFKKIELIFVCFI